jgi:integrase
LLLFTGCRLREILHLRWEHVDFERAASSCQTAKVAGILNAPALAVLTSLEPVSTYVVPGDNLEKPRHDLKRP